MNPNMPLNQQTSSTRQSASAKYIKIWEGNLCGQRRGQPVFITRLECYRSESASEMLAADWPHSIQIVWLISQDHMDAKRYVAKADFLVFRSMNQHGFLKELQERKLCAVIQLPSQTLLLSVLDKACRLIGMLFPGDMVEFKPQIPSQQLQPQDHPQQRMNPNMPLNQQTSSTIQPASAKYIKVWECYRSESASEMLAADWPHSIQIVRLISQDHMDAKRYVAKADFLVFRSMNQHGFLKELQERKLCAVIQLPSQTLLLSVSDKVCRLIGMLFTGDMIEFKPQLPNQQLQPQDHPQQR